MKIIFLDIDGVLNSRIYDGERNLDELSNIDESRLPLLKKLVDETGAKIVLSSTWRKSWNKDYKLCGENGVYINSTFEKYGLKVYGKTPEIGMGFDRYGEIKSYLENCGENIESFVILDDSPFGWKDFSDSFIKTNPHFKRGLEEEHVKRAIQILNA